MECPFVHSVVGKRLVLGPPLREAESGYRTGDLAAWVEEQFPHVVKVGKGFLINGRDPERMSERDRLFNWLNETCEGLWVAQGSSLKFQSKRDAALCRLKTG